MKKIISFVCLLALCLSLVSVTAFAANAAATVSGPATAEVGETFNVTLALSGTNIHGLQGKLDYDATVIRVNSVSAAATGWSVDAYNNNFLAIDDNSEHPINQSTGAVTVNVTLLKGDAGSTATIKFVSLVATNATEDLPVSDAAYTVTVEVEETTQPTEPQPTEPKPTEPKPSKPTTKPTTPATDPTEPATQPSTEATEPATQPSTEATEPTTEPAPAPGDGDDDGKCCWWCWLLILLLILLLIYAYIRYKKYRQARKNQEFNP